MKQAAADRDEAVRQAAARLQGKLGTDDAVPNLTAVLERGTLSEKQNALATLATIEGSLADEVILQWVHHMAEGHVAADLQADLLAAAGQRSDPRIQKAIDELEAARPKGDALATYREALTGGHAEAGRRIFFERAEASCVRCHKIKGEGGEVGPDLTGIGGRQPREYLLESIVAPNAKIAAGFESVLVVMKDGTTYAGVLKSEDATEIAVNSPEDGLLRLKQADIKSREKGLSSMPDGLGTVLTKPELRDLVEFLSELK